MAHYVAVQITPDEAANGWAKAAAQVFGARNIIHRAVRSEMGTRESAYTAAVFSGKLGLLAEAGSNGLRDPKDVSFLTEGILNVAAHLGMLDRAYEPVDPRECRIVQSFVDVRSPAEGLFEPAVAADQSVARGQLLGRVHAFDGTVLAEIASPEDGIVLGIVTAYGVTPGATVIGIGKRQ
jgi:predicted deacylase